MILAQGAVRALRRAGKAAAAIAVVATLAVGLWYGINTISNRNSAASAGGFPLLMYSEFGSRSDTIWAARADDPTQRNRLATIDHAPDYGVFAALSPNGDRIAYTALSPDTVPSNGASAELWVMDRDGRHRELLASDADLPVTPIWSPDGSAVAFRRSDADRRFQIVSVTVDGTESSLLDTADGVLPIGFAPDGALYFARLSSAGSDLGVIRPDGSVDMSVEHLSDDFTRDWHLSPDGARLAFLAPRQVGDRVSYAAVVLDLDGATSMLSATAVADPSDQFNPIWRPDGLEITVGEIDSNAGPGTSLLATAAGGSVVRSLAAPANSGFDVPLSWSPDQGFLAVRYYEGNSPTNPGRSWVTVLSAVGRRATVSPNSDVAILGWVDSGG